MSDEGPKKKRLIVVGDRVLIEPQEGDDRSKVGLYLPKTAVDSQAVQSGRVVATGPGNPVSAPTEVDEEPWKQHGGGVEEPEEGLASEKTTKRADGAVGEPRYVPVQARIGDYAIFFRKAAVEITFEGDRYLVVPQAAILTLIREEDENADDLLPPF